MVISAESKSNILIVSVFNEDLRCIVNAREIRFVAGRDDDLTSVELGEHVILAFSVELGEHVVEEVHGILSRQLAADLALGTFECQNDGALLPL